VLFAPAITVAGDPERIVHYREVLFHSEVNRMRRYLTALAALILVSLAGCATSSGVVLNPAAKRVTYQTAFIVTHGDRSTDMDALLQREMLRHGLGVSAGPEGTVMGDAQLIVRYADDWRWDIKMYLRSFDIMVFDANTKTLLATGSWKNSLLHGFYEEDRVVAKIVDQTLAQVSAAR
jgi:hypothetical protein